MKLAIALLVASSLALVTCAREDGLPDPGSQVLVPCDPKAGPADPLACPPVDAGVDGAVDSGIDTP